MAYRYFIHLSYKGTNYHGWQIQTNGNTIQEELTKSMELVLRQKISLTGAGRTDAGVHAKHLTAHFEMEEPIFDTNKIISKLNNLLPYDIAIHGLEEVSVRLHARFSATSRTYKYYLTTKKNPFSKEFAIQINRSLDFDAMNKAAATLKEYTDFTSFCKIPHDAKTNNCKIMQAYWKQEGDFWVFTIQANRFLRNMVRAVVGTLLEVGKGKISIERFREIIEAKNRCEAGSSAPARGLFLVDVGYPKPIKLKIEDLIRSVKKFCRRKRKRIKRWIKRWIKRHFNS